MADVDYPWELNAYISSDNKLKVEFSPSEVSPTMTGDAYYVSILESTNPMATPVQKDVTNEVLSGSGGEVEFDVTAGKTYNIYLQETPGWGHIAKQLVFTVVTVAVTHASTSSTDDATVKFSTSLADFSSSGLYFVRTDGVRIQLVAGTHYTVADDNATVTFIGGTIDGMWTEVYDCLVAVLGSNTVVEFDPKGVPAVEPSAEIVVAATAETWIKIVNPTNDEVKIVNANSGNVVATVPWVASNDEKVVVVNTALWNDSSTNYAAVIGDKTIPFGKSYRQFKIGGGSVQSSIGAGLLNTNSSSYQNLFIAEPLEAEVTLQGVTVTKQLSSNDKNVYFYMDDFVGAAGNMGSRSQARMHGTVLHHYDYVENGEWKSGSARYNDVYGSNEFYTGMTLSRPSISGSANADNSVTTQTTQSVGGNSPVIYQPMVGSSYSSSGKIINGVYGDEEIVQPGDVPSSQFLYGAGGRSSDRRTFAYVIVWSSDKTRYLDGGGSSSFVPPVISGKYDTKVFKRWLKDGQPYDFTTPVTSDITLEGDWAEAYKVKFVDYDGTELAPAQTVVQGSDFGLVMPSDPTRDGYTFSGWRNMNNADMWDNSSMSVTSDMTLAATYTKNS